ncbi:MAG: hypothetical protein WCO71_13825, partial [Pseudomonadota bacterium]
MLATYQSSNDTLDTYDLATLKKIHSKKMALNRKIRFISMGSLNPSRIFALVETKNQNSGYLSPCCISVPDFNFFDLTPEIKNGNNPLNNSFNNGDVSYNGTMDESGSMCIVSQINRGIGAARYTIRDGGTLDFQMAHTPFIGGNLAFTQNGKFVISDRGISMNGSRQEMENPPFSKAKEQNAPLLMTPLAGYDAIIYRVSSRDFYGLRVRSIPDFGVLMDIPIGKTNNTENSTSPPNRMFASAASDRAVHIMPNENKGILYKLGLKDGSATGGIAQPGKHFERKLTVAPDSKVLMQSGPSGMKLDEKTNSLVWDVPADFKTGQMVQAVLLVTPASGTQQY